MLIDEVEVTVRGYADMDEKEIRKYISYIQEHDAKKLKGGRLTKLTISPAPTGEVNLNYVFGMPKFERIRRITGYLVGTIDRWNNAKRAEEKERVKHSGE
ncbi:MAG: hypothetical protein IKN12_00780 [Selenomonadaceae bacterium]|nr:hypothetical protein [Selenomonadaceae bacterium]